MSGVIGARRNNNIGSCGVAPDCNIVPGIMIPTTKTANFNILLQEFIKSSGKHAIDILNISGGYRGWSPAEFKQYTTYNSLKSLHDYGRPNSDGTYRKIPIFAATGNSGDTVLPAPANLNFVFSVGASNAVDQRKSWYDGYKPTWSSTYHKYMDAVAPVSCNWSTDFEDSILLYKGNYVKGFTTGGYTKFEGTSSAAPIVSGIAALILEKDSMLTAEQVYDAIRYSCEKVGGYSYSNPRADGKCKELGYGRVNACAALNILDELNITKHQMHSKIKIKHTNPANQEVNVNVSGTNNYSLNIYSIGGQLIYQKKQHQESNSTINTQTISKGLYLLEVIDKPTGNHAVSKLIIE